MDSPQTCWKGAALAGWLTTHGVGSAGTITASKERLTVSSALGTFVFEPQAVVCVRRAGFLPWLGAGLLIRHRVAEYPERVGFCTRKISSAEVLRQLRDYGYPVEIG